MLCRAKAGSTKLKEHKNISFVFRNHRLNKLMELHANSCVQFSSSLFNQKAPGALQQKCCLVSHIIHISAFLYFCTSVKKIELLVAVIGCCFCYSFQLSPFPRGTRQLAVGRGMVICACTVFIPLACGTPPCNAKGRTVYCLVRAMACCCLVVKLQKKRKWLIYSCFLQFLKKKFVVYKILP